MQGRRFRVTPGNGLKGTPATRGRSKVAQTLMREGCDRHRFDEKLWCEFTMGSGMRFPGMGMPYRCLHSQIRHGEVARPRAGDSNLVLRLWDQSKINLYTNLG